MDAHECSTMPGDSEAGRVVFSLVRGAKSDDYPDGNASEAWKQLGNRFEPKTAPSRLLIRRELLKLKQKHNQDPEAFITQVEDKVLQYQNAGGHWDEEATLENICGNLKKCYDIVIHPLEKRIGTSAHPRTGQPARHNGQRVTDTLYTTKKY